MDNLLKDHRCPIHGAVLSRHDWAIAQRAIRLPRRVPHVPLLGHGFSLSLTLRACPETIEVRHLDRSAPNHVISTGAKRSGETPVFRPGSCRCPLLKSGISCESVVASLRSRNHVPPHLDRIIWAKPRFTAGCPIHRAFCDGWEGKTLPSQLVSLLLPLQSPLLLGTPRLQPRVSLGL